MVLFLADVEFAAKDRMNAVVLRGVKEMDRAVNVAVVGNGNRLLADPGDALHQLFDVAGAVEQGVVGVQVQVGEFRHGFFFYFRSDALPAGDRRIAVSEEKEGRNF